MVLPVKRTVKDITVGSATDVENSRLGSTPEFGEHIGNATGHRESHDFKASSKVLAHWSYGSDAMHCVGDDANRQCGLLRIEVVE